MKFVIACQKIEVTGVLPTCEVEYLVVGMTLWPKIKWVVAHNLKKGGSFYFQNDAEFQSKIKLRTYVNKFVKFVQIIQ